MAEHVRTIPAGTEVEWVSAGRWWEPVKRGTVIAYLPPMAPLSKVIPAGTPRSRIRGEERSTRRRYVVAVRRPAGKVTYYYTPVAEWLEKSGESGGDHR